MLFLLPINLPSVEIRHVLGKVGEEEDGVGGDPHFSALVGNRVHHELRTSLRHHPVLRRLHWNAVFLRIRRYIWNYCTMLLSNLQQFFSVQLYYVWTCNKSSWYHIHFSREALFFSFRVNGTRTDESDVNVIVGLLHSKSLEKTLHVIRNAHSKIQYNVKRVQHGIPLKKLQVCTWRANFEAVYALPRGMPKERH